MPRIYSDNQAHDFRWGGGVEFIQGVGSVAAGASTTFFGEGYDIDLSKHDRTLLDDLTPAQLRAVCDYIGVTYDAGETPDNKLTITRAIETSLSTKYIAAVTVVSAAGTDAGDTEITITGAGTYKYKTAATAAPAILFKDFPDATWKDIETGDEFTPTATHDKITVIRVNSAGYVIGLGSDDITVNAG